MTDEGEGSEGEGGGWERVVRGTAGGGVKWRTKVVEVGNKSEGEGGGIGGGGR